jgi:hypothetical protein
MYEYVTEEQKTWKAFFCALHHKEFDEILDYWKEYNIGYYIIAMEVSAHSHKETAGEHFHFCAEMSDVTYHAFCKRVFKDRYKLSGQARNGKPKQYGKVTEIKDITRMKAYCIKDDNFYSNLPTEEIEKLREISFSKIETKTKKDKQPSWTQEVVNYLNKEYKRYWDINNPIDKELLVEIIINRLGSTAKAFDEQMVKRLFIGIYNALPKTGNAHRDLKNKMLEYLNK